MSELSNLVSSLKGLADTQTWTARCGIIDLYQTHKDQKGIDNEYTRRIISNGDCSHPSTKSSRCRPPRNKVDYIEPTYEPQGEILRTGCQGVGQVGGRCGLTHPSGLQSPSQHRETTRGRMIAEDAYIPKKAYYKELVKSLKTIGKGGGDMEALNQGTQTRARENLVKDKVISVAPHRELVGEVRMSPSEVKEMIRGNCSLIKTVDKDLIPGIERRVKRLYEHTNTTRETLARYLEGECGLEPWQADRIINDQMNKYDARATIETMKRNGVKLVRWCAGKCEHHRPTHVKKWPRGLNGCVFDINHPPIDPATGTPTMPGEQINCHCYLEVVK